MALDPTLSLAVLTLLALVLVVAVVRSVLNVTKRVIQVGLIVAILAGAGVLQIPADTPVVGGMADGVQSSITGMIPGTTELPNSTNVTASQENAAGSLVDQLIDIVASQEQTP